MAPASAQMTEARALRRVRRLVKNGALPELLEEAGLYQGDVARALGVAPSTVSRWVSGEIRRPRGSHAVALLELLDGDE